MNSANLGSDLKPTCFKILLATLLAATLAGCSKVSVSYRFADWFIVYKLDKAFDLNKNQKRVIDSQLENYLKWNKQHMVPKYRDQLNQINALIQSNNYQYESWGPTTLKLKTLVTDSVKPLTPHFVDLLIGLDEKQLAHFKNYLATDQSAKVKDYSDAKEVASKRFKGYSKNFKFWFGTMTEEQSLKLKNLSHQSKFPIKLWLQKRQSQQQTFLALLNESPRDRRKLENFINSYITQVGQTELEKKFYIEVQDVQVDIFLKLVKLTQTLTAVQKKKLAKRVKNLNFDLNKLSQKIN